MINRTSLLLLVCLTSVLMGGSCRKYNHSTLVGVYTSHLPRNGPLIKFDEMKYDGKMVPMSVYMIYLRADSTFVMGGCDLQIREAGRYSFQKDSIGFENIYSFKEKKYLADKVFFFDSKSASIYYRHPNPDSTSCLDYPESIAILELNFRRSHMGFLRNQRMGLDSLLRYNTFFEYPKQMIWVNKAMTMRDSKS